MNGVFSFQYTRGDVFIFSELWYPVSHLNWYKIEKWAAIVQTRVTLTQTRPVCWSDVAKQHSFETNEIKRTETKIYLSATAV